MSVKNHYVTLEISPDATQSEIKTAYQILARVWHPDRFQGDLVEIASRKMTAINAAYDVLKEPQQRAAHDATLRREQPPQTPAPKPASRKPAAESPRPTPNTRPTSPPPKPSRPEPQKVSAQRRLSISASVKAHFNFLIAEHPSYKSDLLSVLNWQMTQEANSTWRCKETGESEESALKRWSDRAKNAGDNAVKIPQPQQPPTVPKPQHSTTEPRTARSAPRPESARLREQVISSVRFYYEELMIKHPMDKQALISALHWQLTQQKTVMARGAHSGKTEEELMWGWAYQAKRAADSKIETRSSQQKVPTSGFSRNYQVPEQKVVSDHNFTSKPASTQNSEINKIFALYDSIVFARKNYYIKLIEENPSKKAKLTLIFNEQMERREGAFNRFKKQGSTDQDAVYGWAYEAKCAADKELEKNDDS